MPRIMCFGSGDKDDPDAQKNRLIEKQLKEDRERAKREIKMLLLGRHPPPPHVPAMSPNSPGAGESGKSTVLKQMRLIHAKGFSPAERKQWKVTIYHNLLHAFQVIFGAMEEQEVNFADETNIVSAVEAKSLDTPDRLSVSQSWSPPTPTLAATTRCPSTACAPFPACGPTPASKKPLQKATNTPCTTT